MLSAKPKAEAGNTNRELVYLGYQKNESNDIIVLLYVVLKKITTNTLSQGT